ncbi:uncharacterized protein EV420DRAFT_1673477 [Desarmillaria tabescens]|uniref:Uncharacterized protein n=1 Tax=Armillaria tabescens TaxID=1929756 RepID=A0AA39KHV0_ARMTA|nr:uncharacterized protein EV420DRAFT_1673477 [Desarmillaria tabescens]KAK0460271.1 hypothetical protein EV420DRAFT_1673477 [Desarmillaria tabescens]
MDPPPDLSPDIKSVIFNKLDQELNCVILNASLHGLYTGTIVVTLWTIFSSPKRLKSTFLCTTIIMLYVLSTISFTTNWVSGHHAFIEYSDNYFQVFAVLQGFGPWWRVNYLVDGVMGGVSTLLVDIVIVWRCWTLWDHQWRVVLIPMICTIAGTVMKTMQIFSLFHNFTHDISKTVHLVADVNWSLIYILLTLTTTLMCTILITYRILRNTPRMTASRNIVEMLIESSAMYSLSLIIYLALVSKNSQSGYYADMIAAYVKVIAPTLLVGRVSAHANVRSRRQQMVAMLENHPPLVGCFREECTENSHACNDPNDGHQTVSGMSGEETV